MNQALDLLFAENPAERHYRQLLVVRAALAGVALSRTAAPDSLQDAAWTLDGLCEGLAHMVEELPKQGGSEIIDSLCLTVRVGLTQVQRELARRAMDPYHALVRARSLLLRALAVLVELEHAVSRRRGEMSSLLDPLDVARAIVLIAVRGNTADHTWIIQVAEAELGFLAAVPTQRMDDTFLRKLSALRALVTECANYESRKTVRVPAQLG
jgi:hypothetical protein